MKKQVNVQVTERGQKFFFIYEVRAHCIKDDKNIMVEMYLNEKDAQKEMEFCEEVHKNLYDGIWIRKRMVWC